MIFETALELDGQVQVIKLPKRVSGDVAGDLREHLRKLAAGEVYKWIFDLSETSYIDSQGLGALVCKIAECRSHSGDICLAGTGEFVGSLIHLTHLNKVLKSFSNVAEAIAYYQNPTAS